MLYIATLLIAGLWQPIHTDNADVVVDVDHWSPWGGNEIHRISGWFMDYSVADGVWETKVRVLRTHDMNSAETAAGIGAKIKGLRKYVGTAYYNITVSVYDCDIKDPTNDRVYTNALLVGMTEPEGDSSSGAPATFALTFAISDVDAQ